MVLFNYIIKNSIFYKKKTFKKARDKVKIYLNKIQII